MKCLILAAGFGNRMGSSITPKPLLELDGVPLIERVMLTNYRAGITQFVVVSGYQGEQLREHLREFAERAGFRVEHTINDEFDRGNGISVLKARDFLDDPFILSMSDHLYQSAIVSNLIAAGSRQHGSLTLAVDKNINNPDVDLDDVTRVREVDSRIEAIGKGISDYNCFDTGVFLATPGLFDAIELSIDNSGDDSLSGGVRTLAADNRAFTYDIGGHYWTDIDTPLDLARVRLDRLDEPSIRTS